MIYKLIKEYPGSPKLGYEISSENKTSEWKGTDFYNNYPEYWLKIENDLSYYNKKLNIISKLFNTNLKIADTAIWTEEGGGQIYTDDVGNNFVSLDFYLKNCKILKQRYDKEKTKSFAKD
jgi:hypothetical protein